MKNERRTLLLLACALGLFVAVPASAGTILSPVAVLSNTMGETPGGEAILMINHAGLLTNFVSGVTDFDTYINGNPLHTMVFGNSEFWSAAGVSKGRLEFDLGAEYSIDRMALWNEDAVGVSNMVLYGSATNDFNTAVNLGAFQPADNPINIDYGPETFALSALTARYIWMDVSSTDLWGGQHYVAIGELAFSVQAAQIPEPASLILLGTGLVGIGLAAWRKKK